MILMQKALYLYIHIHVYNELVQESTRYKNNFKISFWSGTKYLPSHHIPTALIQYDTSETNI